MPVKGEDDVWIEQKGKIVKEYLPWTHDAASLEDDSDEFGAFVCLDPDEEFKIWIRRGKGISNRKKNINLAVYVSINGKKVWEGEMKQEGVVEYDDDERPLKPPKPTTKPDSIKDQVMYGGSDRGDSTKGIITVTLGYCKIDHEEDSITWLTSKDDLKLETRPRVGDGVGCWHWDFTFVCCAPTWLRSKGLNAHLPAKRPARLIPEVIIPRASSVRQTGNISRTRSKKKYKKTSPPRKPRSPSLEIGRSISPSTETHTPPPPPPAEKSPRMQIPAVQRSLTVQSTPATLVEVPTQQASFIPMISSSSNLSPTITLKRKNLDDEEPIYPSDANLLDTEDALMFRYLFGKIASRKRKSLAGGEVKVD